MIGVKKLRLFYKILFVFILLFCVGCEQQDKSAIAKLLDNRNTAVIEKDIDAYSNLLSSKYHNKQDIIHQMHVLFKQFKHIQMHSHNRHIRIIDEEHAECEQSYTLSVESDGHTRHMIQREQLQLIKTEQGWKISAGL